MRKNIADVLKNPGTALPLDFEADMSDIELYGERIFPDPVRVTGEVRNRAGLVTVEADIYAVGRASCARCLEPAEFVCDIPLDLTVTENTENAELEDYVYVEGDMLDLHGVVRDELILSCGGEESAFLSELPEKIVPQGIRSRKPQVKMEQLSLF